MAGLTESLRPVRRAISVSGLLIVHAYSQTSVTTYRNDLARTGANLQETVLTLSNVNPTRFGKLFSQPVDGQIYAQPLYLPSIAIPGKGTHNVVFAATAHDTVYAFDADSNTGLNASPLWRVNLAEASPGERPATVDDVQGCNAISPEIGITATPVIDPHTGVLYVIGLTIRDGSFIHRLHALDIATGSERPGSPVEIAASVPGTGDGFSTTSVVFRPYSQKSRAGLLLLNGVVYTAWTSFCDGGVFHGWILGYDAKTLRQTAVFNSSPNSWQSSFWMGGAAPAADSSGNIYAISGNGAFDDAGDFGDSILKLAGSPGGLTVSDYFTPFNQAGLSRNDLDLGSGAAVLLPDSVGTDLHRHLLVSGGKEGRIYLIDRDGMGRFRAEDDSQVVQTIGNAIGPLFGGPAYFDQTLYFSASNDALRAFSISGAQLGAAPMSRSAQTFGYPGTVPAVSANGSTNGIVWLLESGGGGTLHAYNALDLGRELYNSRMNPPRDGLDSFVKFTVPTIANGKVYAGTGNSLAVFGLLDPPAPLITGVVNAASLLPGAVAPGSLISIFGSNIADTTASQSAPLASALGGASLWIGGVAGAVQYVSPGQMNAQVPFEVVPGVQAVELRKQSGVSAFAQVTIAPAAPGIFASGPNQAAIQNEDGGLNTASDPAAAGSVITVYVTGQGAVQPSIATGALAPAGATVRATGPVTVAIGGQTAALVLAGLSTDAPGVFEVKLRLPFLDSGSYPLQVSVSGVTSNMRTVFVSRGQ